MCSFLGCFLQAATCSTLYSPIISARGDALPEHELLDQSADKRLLTDNPQHAGDGVALIVADTRTQARAAVRGALAEWEVLRAVTTLDQAVSEGRTLLEVTVGDRDAEPAAAVAPLTISHQVRLDRAQHVCLEPHACTAIPGPGSSIELHTNTQSPAEVRKLASRITGLAADRLRVIKHNEGGGFGNKQELYEEAVRLRRATRSDRRWCGPTGELSRRQPSWRMSAGAQTRYDVVRARCSTAQRSPPRWPGWPATSPAGWATRRGSSRHAT